MEIEAARWTARAVFVLYCVALCVSASGPRWRTSRMLWTAGCVGLWIHIAAAMGLVHEWSHTRAYEHTARGTADMVGIDWGGGLYVNYAMALAWLTDAAWWWLNAESYRDRPRLLHTLIHSAFGFLFVQAAVVFAPSPARWIAALLFVSVLTARLAAKSGDGLRRTFSLPVL